MAESHREEIAKLEALYAGNPGGRVFVHLAEAYRKAGEHERARRILDEGLARHSDSASGYVVLGRVLADMQVTAEAEVAFRRVLELDGGNLVALRWLGDLARQSGRNAEAASHYRELLVRNPSNEEVRDLVEIVERSDPAARPGETESDESPITDWADPSDEAPGASAEAVEEPISPFEEAAVSPPRTLEPEPADITPWSTAPGHTDDVTEAPVEYGVVEIDALPGDTLHLEAADEHASAAEQPAQQWTSADQVAEPPRQEADADLVATWDSENADVLELDELTRDDEAEPMEIHLLDPAYEGGEDDTEDLDVALDLTDLSSLDTEDDVEYADDEFLADLASVPPEEMDGDDYAPPGADFTLLPEAPESVDSTAADRTLERTAENANVSGGHYDVVADEPFDVPADEPYDVAADEPFDLVEDVSLDSAPEAYSGEEEADTPGERAVSELAGAAEPAAEAHEVSEASRSAEAPGAAPSEAAAAGIETGLVTETMAVLYRTQGFHDRAAEVYRALLRSRPGDERLSARLKEAEQAASAPSAVSEPDDEAGEVWLRGVGAAWTATGTEGAEGATPYAWTDAPEEVESGEPISDYLRELVAWKGGQARWSEAAQEPAPSPVRGTDADATPPDWLMAGDEGALPWADAAAEEVASWSPAQLPEEETGSWSPAGEPEPAPAADAAPEADDDMPADPWLHAVPVADEAAFEPLEAAEPEPAPAPSDDDAGAGWTPFELDRDAPAAPAPTGPAEVPPPAVSMSADDDPAEDEDLEMFRSWLQSLKK